jgi:hypothetical protein
MGNKETENPRTTRNTRNALTDQPTADSQTETTAIYYNPLLSYTNCCIVWGELWALTTAIKLD